MTKRSQFLRFETEIDGPVFIRVSSILGVEKGAVMFPDDTHTTILLNTNSDNSNNRLSYADVWEPVEEVMRKIDGYYDGGENDHEGEKP